MASTSVQPRSILRTPSMTNLHGPQRSERIPSLLQSVFLKSNRGVEVHKAPPQQMAHKVYTTNWAFRRAEMQSGKKIYEKTKDKVLSENKKRGMDVPSESCVPISSITVPVIVMKDEKVDYSLQEYFDALLKERGYEPLLFNTLETAYYNKSTEIQMASYGPRMVQIVRSSDAQALREVFMGGLSPNPCNKFGESLLHMVCRRGDLALLNVMVEAGAVLEVSDDYGRTPLHDACWAANPAFEVVKVLLHRDPYMFFLKDKRGSLPLSYVPKADWTLWREWLDENIDRYYPESQAPAFVPSDMCTMPPNSFPLPYTKNSLSMELLQMIANGDMSPREARLVAESALNEDEETMADTLDPTEFDESEYDSEDSDDFSSDSDYDSEDEDEDEDFEMGEDDMMEMLRMAQARRVAT